MKKTVSLAFILFPTFVFANICELSHTIQIVEKAAQSIETINGGRNPLSTEIYSFSSEKNKWAILFSYSGIQNTWAIKTDDSGCRVESVSKP